MVEQTSPMDDGLIERLRRTRRVGDFRHSMTGETIYRRVPINPDGPEAATALQTLTDKVERLEEALRLLPDEIDLFRTIRAAGRSNIEKARAVATLLTPYATLTKDGM